MKLIVRVELDRNQIIKALENYIFTFNLVCHIDVLKELLESSNINDFNNAIAIGLKYNGCDRSPEISGDRARLISQIVSKYFTP